MAAVLVALAASLEADAQVRTERAAALTVAPALMVRCKGCGCRGGPGWRVLKTGRCAGHRDFRKRCGNPPSTRRCKCENGRACKK